MRCKACAPRGGLPLCTRRLDPSATDGVLSLSCWDIIHSTLDLTDCLIEIRSFMQDKKERKDSGWTPAQSRRTDGASTDAGSADEGLDSAPTTKRRLLGLLRAAAEAGGDDDGGGENTIADEEDEEKQSEGGKPDQQEGGSKGSESGGADELPEK